MKIYDELLKNLDQINDEIYLKSLLLEYNLWIIFSPIYAINKEVHFGNICTSFIILAYSNGCKWLDYSKDRMTVKLEVMTSIMSQKNIQISDQLKDWNLSIVQGDNETVENIISDYVDWQKDGLFDSFITLTNHISLCNRNARSSYGVTSKILNERGKYLDLITKLEEDKSELIRKIESKYQSLDEALKQENKTPISNRSNISTWEKLVEGMNVKTNS